MEEPKCEFENCQQCAQLVCYIDKSLLCSDHSTDHLSTPGDHVLYDVYQALTPGERVKVKQASLNLFHFVQSSLYMRLLKMSLSSANLSEQDSLTHSKCVQTSRVLLRSLRRATQVSLEELFARMLQVYEILQQCQACKTKASNFYTIYKLWDTKHHELQRLTSIGRDLRVDFDGILNQQSAADWSLSGFKTIRFQADSGIDHGPGIQHSTDLFMKANLALAEDRLPDTLELYSNCANTLRNQGLHDELPRILIRLGMIFEDLHQFEEAMEQYLEAVTTFRRRMSPRATSDFRVLLGVEFFLAGPVPLIDLIERLETFEGEITRLQAYECFFSLLEDQVKQHFVEPIARYQQQLIKLAFVEFERGIIDSAHQEGCTEDRFQYFPLAPANEARTQYQFLHPSLVEYLVAKNIVEELKVAVRGRLGWNSMLNLCNLVPRKDVREFIIEITQKQPDLVTEVLIDIVLQTRHRSDITQASANSITLLNQMNYCFAQKDFSSIKISGADLSGANLFRTNLRKSELKGVKLHGCKLLKTKLQQCEFTHGQTGIILSIRNSSAHMLAACFSLDGLLIASGSTNNMVHLWSDATGQYLRTFQGHSSQVTAVCFSPDSVLLASASDGGELILWELASGEQLRVLRHESGEVRAVCFSPDGALVAAGSHNARKVTVWNPYTGEVVWSPPAPTASYLGKLWALCFGPNDALFAAGNYNKRAMVWDAFSGQQVRSLQGHFVLPQSMCFSVDGALIASSNENNQIIIWESASGRQVQVVHTYSSDVTAMCFSPDRAVMVLGADDKRLVVCEVATPPLINEFHGHSKEVRAIAFSPDGSRVISAGADNLAIVWDSRTGEPLLTLEVHPSSVAAVCYSPDGSVIVTGSPDKSLTVWDSTTGRRLQSSPAASMPVFAIYISDGGHITVCCCAQKAMTIWYPSNKQSVSTMQAHTWYITCASFSQDGSLIATSSKDKNVVIWDVCTAKEVCRLHNPNADGGGKSVCFSPDSALVALGTQDAKVIVWDVPNMQLVQTLVGHSHEVRAVCFSSDGAFLASGSSDRSIIIWDVSTGQQARTVYSHSKEVTALKFSPDSSLIASGSRTGQFTCTQLNLYEEI